MGYNLFSYHIYNSEVTLSIHIVKNYFGSTHAAGNHHQRPCLSHPWWACDHAKHGSKAHRWK